MAGRTLVFSFDGTGNEPSDARKYRRDESISNVFKLHVMMGGGGVREDRSDTRTCAGAEQKTFYYTGIGTREGMWRFVPVVNWVVKSINFPMKFMNKVFAPTLGDAGCILCKALRTLKEEKCLPEDRVVVFGYSRGAALARKFVSKALRKKLCSRVAFLGVFDTVAAMNGIHTKWDRTSSKVFFEDHTLDPRVERAVHLLSIDEERVAFTPTLINKDADQLRRILEVWFPGIHGNVGGGYAYDGLSDIALRFMIDECRKALGNDISIRKEPDGIARLLKEQGEALSEYGLSVDHFQVVPRPDGAIHQVRDYWRFITGIRARSIHVSENDAPSPHEDDVPVLHYSVKKRVDSPTEYRPLSLKGLRFRLLHEDGNLSPVMCGLRDLREYSLP